MAPARRSVRVALREVRLPGEAGERFEDANLASLQVRHLARSDARIAAAEPVGGQVSGQALVNDWLLDQGVHEGLLVGERDVTARPRQRGGRVDVVVAFLRAVAAD